MEHSPRGREIEYLDGNASEIKTHGRRIRSIGRQMTGSADVLEELVTGEDGQKGKAIDKIREIVGETYAELRRAGNMYEPTGPVLIAYGDAVEDLQPRIRVVVDNCHESWTVYSGAPGNRNGRPFPPTDPDEAEQAAAEDEARQDLYEDWQADARAFDNLYDDWSDAFDTAVRGIGDVLDGSIKDSFWDNLDGVVSVVLEVLGWVGLIVAIAGIIIGGPLFALIGAVIGVATLLLTAYQVLRDDAGMDKLIIAIIGVVPFGKLGKLFQGKAGLVDFAGDMFTAFRPSSWSAAAGQLGQMRTILNFSPNLANGAWNVINMNNRSIGDVLTRFMFGRDTTSLSNLAESIGGASGQWARSNWGAAAWEGAYMLVSGAWGIGDKIAKWTGNADRGPSSQAPWVGAFL
ncbi:hypothetical protein [Microbacterium invictum]|uniref:Uncharacterized protein n=2 Tax=Microbacterium invictum TaxID=515415 RepID=A0AA40SPK3_9MICO|nr:MULTISPECIES: hypothetical protein [Microbacterium]MBB4139905.1 hypothetical protein [Microbacterium invictum]